MKGYSSSQFEHILLIIILRILGCQFIFPLMLFLYQSTFLVSVLTVDGVGLIFIISFQPWGYTIE